MWFPVFISLVLSSAWPTSASHVVELNGKNILGFLESSGKDVLLEVYAPGCSFCQTFQHSFRAVAYSVLQAKGEAIVARLNIETPTVEMERLRSAWGIRGVPSVFVLKKGKYETATLLPGADLWEGGSEMAPERILSFLHDATGHPLVPHLDPPEGYVQGEKDVAPKTAKDAEDDGYHPVGGHNADVEAANPESEGAPELVPEEASDAPPEDDADPGRDEWELDSEWGDSGPPEGEMPALDEAQAEDPAVQF